MVIEEFKPPVWPNCNDETATRIFLAGTIDMGNSIDWQSMAVDKLNNYDKARFYIMNPRRDDFDNSADQLFENPYFYQQVNWELTNLDNSDIIIMCLLKGSKSPISLLEMGLYAKSNKLLVVCDNEFYRVGNIQIVCTKYKIPVFTDLESLISSRSFMNLIKGNNHTSHD